MAENNESVAIDVIILTENEDIKGTVHVSKSIAENRQLTELLNDTSRRFLAITNAEIYQKNSNQPPKRFEFLEIHMDKILMVHPISQAVFKDTPKTQEDIARFRELRAKLNQTKPF